MPSGLPRKVMLDYGLFTILHHITDVDLNFTPATYSDKNM